MPAVRRAAGAAALLTLLVRLPFVARRMWDHDAVQFALAVRNFDLAAHHPHPPGYPIYVALLKLLAAVGIDPLHGMVALSLAASVGGAACFALLVARLAAVEEGVATDAREAAREERGAATIALFAGVLYATDPLLWFYGELPLVYAVEGGLTAMLALAAVRMGDSPRSFYSACMLFAVAGGLRPTTQILLLPLALYALLRAWRRATFLTPRRLAAGAALAVACTLGWVVPLLTASGGLAAYRRIADAHFTQLLPVTSVLFGAGLPALSHNLTVLLKWALQGTLSAMAAVAVAWALAPRRAADGLRLLAARAGWIVVWAVPPIAFFACFHVTKAGYTLIHLPALLAALVLLAAPALRRGGAALGGGVPTVNRAAVAGAVVITVAATLGAGIFVFGAPRPIGAPRWEAPLRHEFNRTAIRTYERDLDALLATLETYPKPGTLLAAVELAGRGGAGSVGFLYSYHRHLQWYEPDRPVALLVPEDGVAHLRPAGGGDFERYRGVLPVPSAVDRLVLVLAGRPDPERLTLPPAEVVLANDTFLVLALPFRGDLRIGGVELRRAGAPATAAVGG